jgi:hypothetical protein
MREEVRERLLDGRRDARELLGEARAHVGDHLLAAAPRVRVERHDDLGEVHVVGVLVALSAPRLAPEGRDPGHAREHGLEPLPVGVGRREARAGREDEVHLRRPLVERREELRPARREHDDARRRRGEHDGRDPPRVPAGEGHHPLADRLGLPYDPAVAVPLRRLGPREEPRAQDRRDGQRDDERREDADDVGDADRREEPPLHPRQREERQVDDDDHERADEDRLAHLARRAVDDEQGVRGRGRPPVLAQAPEDVLDVHDRVVHEGADGDGEAAERHRVDRDARRGEHERRDGDREGDRRERDERRPEVQEEQEEHDDDEDPAVAHRLRDVLDGAVDEARLLVDLRDEHDVLGQRGRDRRELAVDPVGQVHGVGRGLLEDREDDAGPRVDARLADADRGRAERDLGDVPQAHGAHGIRAHDGRLEVGRALDEAGDAHERPLGADREHAARARAVRGAHGVGHRLERDFVRPQAVGVHRHLELLGASADRDDLRDARERQETRLHDAVGERAEDRRVRGAGPALDPHLEDLAHDARDGRHRGLDARRELRLRGRELLLHHLAVAEDLGLPAELDEDDREPEARRRADALDARGTVDRLLDRARHEALDVLGHHPVRLGHHRDRRAVQVGEHVHREPRRHPAPPRADRERERRDDAARTQAGGDDPVEHGPSVSGGGPRARRRRRRRPPASRGGRRRPREGPRGRRRRRRRRSSRRRRARRGAPP